MCIPTSPLLVHTNGCSGWFTIVIIFTDDLCCSFLGDSRKEVLDWINMGRPHYLTPAFLHAGWLISYGSPCSSHTWLLVVRGIESCVLWRCLQDGATHQQSVIVFYMSKKEKARRHLKNCKAHAERWYSLKQKKPTHEWRAAPNDFCHVHIPKRRGESLTITIIRSHK